MLEEQANQEAFEAFRRHEMSAPERVAFETALAQDPALRQAYTLYIECIEGIKDAKRQEMKLKLLAWDAEMPPVSGSRPLFWKIAASIALVIALSAAFYLSKLNQTPLYTAEHYVEDPGLPVLMGAATSWGPAMNAYRAGNYSLALQALPAQAGQDTTAFFKGLFFLKLKQPATALVHFNQKALIGSAYAEKAAYYRAIALWQANKRSDARKAMQQIAQLSHHPFQKEAEQVLQTGSL